MCLTMTVSGGKSSRQVAVILIVPLPFARGVMEICMLYSSNVEVRPETAAKRCSKSHSCVRRKSVAWWMTDTLMRTGVPDSAGAGRDGAVHSLGLQVEKTSKSSDDAKMVSDRST